MIPLEHKLNYNLEEIDNNDYINVSHLVTTRTLDVLCLFCLLYVTLQLVCIFYTVCLNLCLPESMEKPNTLVDFVNQVTESHVKLPTLHEGDDRFSFSTGCNQLDALFLDTTTPISSFEHTLQELADIESQYSELIKPCIQTDQDVNCFEPSDERKLSTDEVIRLGGERFVQSRSTNDMLVSTHPYAGSFSGLSDKQLKDVQLIENLLLSSEKVSQQKFDRARTLLDWCDALSSSSGNPIQRIVYYFSKALREKISGINSLTESGKKHASETQERMMSVSPNMSIVSMYQKLPFFQAGHFAGVQALVDRLSRSKRVHVIDLAIRQGVHTTILMQALASQPGFHIKHLKITAVGPGFESQVKQTGDRLKSFAKSINISFTFNIVIVEDMLEFNKDVLQLNPTEALGVFSSYGLWNLIAQQDRLESLMKVIKSAKPRVMVVCEVAANLNSPGFVNRLIEALFHYGALFESLEYYMDRDDENRGIIECMYLGEGIRSIVGAEGVERVIRHVNIDVWRKFFVRFGMKEIKFSMSSLYQAKLVVGSSSSTGNCCTFDTNGESVIIGWKGTPITCVSAWEFSRDR